MSMKTNKFLRIASVLLIAVLLTTCVISGTFAKYISEFSAQDTARVAKWQFEVNDVDVTAGTNLTFDLFNTINDTLDGNKETDVDDDETLIAPGTTGSFLVKVENLSEVNAKVDFAFTATTNNIPLEFSLTGEDDDWTDDIATLNSSVASLDMNDGVNTQTVYWRWVYEAVTPNTNDADTTLGIAGTAVATVNVAITATQVD